MEKTTEYTIMIYRWDDQTGGWFEVTQPPNQEKAEELVKDYMNADESNGRVVRYRIAVTTFFEYTP